MYWKFASNQNGVFPKFFWALTMGQKFCRKTEPQIIWSERLTTKLTCTSGSATVEHKNQKANLQYIAVIGVLLLPNGRRGFCKAREATVISKIAFFGSLIKITALKDGVPYGTAKGFPSSE